MAAAAIDAREDHKLLGRERDEPKRGEADGGGGKTCRRRLWPLPARAIAAPAPEEATLKAKWLREHDIPARLLGRGDSTR